MNRFWWLVPSKESIHFIQIIKFIYINWLNILLLSFNLFKIVTYLSRLRSWGEVWHFRIFIRSEHLWKERERESGLKREKLDCHLYSEVDVLWWESTCGSKIFTLYSKFHTSVYLPLLGIFLSPIFHFSVSGPLTIQPNRLTQLMNPHIF